MMVNIAGKLINPLHVVSAEVETRHYMNGSQSTLVIRLAGGPVIRKDHGYGFDAWADLIKLEAAMRVAPIAGKRMVNHD